MVGNGRQFLFLPPQSSNTCDTQGGSLETSAPVVLDTLFTENLKKPQPISRGEHLYSPYKGISFFTSVFYFSTVWHCCFPFCSILRLDPCPLNSDFFSSWTPWMGCLSIAGLPPALNSPVPMSGSTHCES